MILIIEDEPLIAKMLGDIATELFDNFTVVNNLSDAMDYDPVAVIVDGCFPDTANGTARENWNTYLSHCDAKIRIISSGDAYIMEKAVMSGLATHQAEKHRSVQLLKTLLEEQNEN